MLHSSLFVHSKNTKFDFFVFLRSQYNWVSMNSWISWWRWRRRWRGGGGPAVNLKQWTRSPLIHILMGTATILDSIIYRPVVFFTAWANHKYNIISFVFENVLLSNSSNMSTNICKVIQIEKCFHKKSKLNIIVNNKRGENKWLIDIVE